MVIVVSRRRIARKVTRVYRNVELHAGSPYNGVCMCVRNHHRNGSGRKRRKRRRLEYYWE